MIPVKYIRSLADDNAIYPNYPDDGTIAAAISTWAKNIKLARDYFDLDIPATSVFQLTSSDVANRHVYVASVDDPKIIQNIIETVKAKKLLSMNSVKEFRFPENSPGALLYLQRYIGRRPRKTPSPDESGPQERMTLRSHPYYVEDIYWLTVLDDEGKPVFDVHHDSASFTFVEKTVLADPKAYANRLNEYFPEPDEVLVDWHDMAELLSLSNRLEYAYALCSAANICRHVWGWSPWGMRQILYFGDPAADPSSMPFPEFFASDLRILNLYQEDPSAGVDPLPPDLPVSQLPGVGNLRARLDTLPRLRPDYRPTPLCEAFIRHLSELAGIGASYRGNGWFSVRSEDLHRLAAGTGNWGSGESFWLGLTIDVAKDGAAMSSTAAGISAVVVSGVGIWRTTHSDEYAATRETCRRGSRTTGECVDCVLMGEEGTLELVEGTAGLLGVVYGVAAAAGMTGVGVPIAIGLAILGGILVAVDIGVNRASIQRSCAGNRT